MDKRLAFGRIVGKKVKFKETNEIGVCDYYDRVEKCFYVLLESRKSKCNPEGSLCCEREDFEVL